MVSVGSKLNDYLTPASVYNKEYGYYLISGGQRKSFLAFLVLQEKA